MVSAIAAAEVKTAGEMSMKSVDVAGVGFGTRLTFQGFKLSSYWFL